MPTQNTPVEPMIQSINLYSTIESIVLQVLRQNNSALSVKSSNKIPFNGKRSTIETVWINSLHAKELDLVLSSMKQGL